MEGFLKRAFPLTRRAQEVMEFHGRGIEVLLAGTPCRIKPFFDELSLLEDGSACLVERRGRDHDAGLVVNEPLKQQTDAERIKASEPFSIVEDLAAHEAAQLILQDVVRSIGVQELRERQHPVMAASPGPERDGRFRELHPRDEKALNEVNAVSSHAARVGNDGGKTGSVIDPGISMSTNTSPGMKGRSTFTSAPRARYRLSGLPGASS
jgi:hypothetical protein